MKLIVDTNQLVRILVQDDPDQAAAATLLLDRADRLAIPVTTFCEMAWVLRSRYRLSAADIATGIEAIVEIDKVVTDRAAVAAGLRMLTHGADFADGVIASTGEALGGEIFASFDKSAREGWERRSGGLTIDPLG